ncbi:ABC transporter ATP-binding protein [Fervidibacillus albus]|uniref:Carnitine transport ATP-binding protein OpuCA n=1 Tax=Fervidibacillus albus TaxID=2980026 RepID=A0A9E8LTY7_9BACI|nr:ABC transporter ATP-binding protein [Fervidibacillus albus]WAA09578.1 ABC transporter ATP-binding protein [Fervidibacillus albus]
MIRFENVSKKYDDGTVAVDSLNVEINRGEFFVFIGPSGSGKTTSLKMINQLVPLSDGMIYINGKQVLDYDIYELRWNIGYVLQQIALFPHMTIEQNITVVPEMKKWSKEKMKKRAYELMEMVGLDPAIYANRKPHQLSGGEQQRVGVIRALAADSEIILMDEPFSALDPISREKLQDDLLHLKNQLKKTTVFVTHDMEEALKLADRICIMKDGKAVQVGTPFELIHHPANEFVHQFVGGKGNRIEGDFQLEQLLSPSEETTIEDPMTIDTSASLNEVLEKLAEHEQLLVVKNGERIGTINRQRVIQYLSKNVQGRGQSNE